MSNDGQFGIPSLVVVLVITGLVWKYLWPSGSSSGSSGQGRDSLSQMRQREVAVERIQQMFPQVDRRTILWDLQRNGGSIAATTEKILSGTIQTVSFLSFSGCIHTVYSMGTDCRSSHPSPSNRHHRQALTQPPRRQRSLPPRGPLRSPRSRT